MTDNIHSDRSYLETFKWVKADMKGCHTEVGEDWAVEKANFSNGNYGKILKGAQFLLNFLSFLP